MQWKDFTSEVLDQLRKMFYYKELLACSLLGGMSSNDALVVVNVSETNPQACSFFLNYTTSEKRRASCSLLRKDSFGERGTSVLCAFVRQRVK